MVGNDINVQIVVKKKQLFYKQLAINLDNGLSKKNRPAKKTDLLLDNAKDVEKQKEKPLMQQVTIFLNGGKKTTTMFVNVAGVVKQKNYRTPIIISWKLKNIEAVKGQIWICKKHTISILNLPN